MKEANNINQLLEEICRTNSLYDVIIDNIIAPNYHLKSPLISEIAVSFLSNEEKIMEVYSTGNFKYYFARVVMNQIKSKTSPLHLNHRTTLNDMMGDKRDWDYIPDVMDDSESEIDKKIDDELKHQSFEETKNDSWYESEICNMHFVQGYSTRQIEKIDDIDHVSVWKTINKFKKRVRENYVELKNKQ